MESFIDNWQDWPAGEEGHNIHPDEMLCPICSSSLRTIKKVYSDECMELWRVICPSCQTQYVTSTEPGLYQEQSVNPLEEQITKLEARIAQLEELVSSLLQERKQYPPTRPSRDEDDNNAVYDIIPDEYRYLLH